MCPASRSHGRRHRLKGDTVPLARLRSTRVVHPIQFGIRGGRFAGTRGCRAAPARCRPSSGRMRPDCGRGQTNRATRALPVSRPVLRRPLCRRIGASTSSGNANTLRAGQGGHIQDHRHNLRSCRKFGSSPASRSDAGQRNGPRLRHSNLDRHVPPPNRFDTCATVKTWSRLTSLSRKAIAEHKAVELRERSRDKCLNLHALPALVALIGCSGKLRPGFAPQTARKVSSP